MSTQGSVSWIYVFAFSWMWWLWLFLVYHSGKNATTQAGHFSWAVPQVSSGSYWQQRLLELHDLHPHPARCPIVGTQEASDQGHRSHGCCYKHKWGWNIMEPHKMLIYIWAFADLSIAFRRCRRRPLFCRGYTCSLDRTLSGSPNGYRFTMKSPTPKQICFGWEWDQNRTIQNWLVVWNMNFMNFPSYWEFHHPNWRSPSFFRGGGQPQTRLLLTIINHIYI